MSRKRTNRSATVLPTELPDEYYAPMPELAVAYDIVAEPLHNILHRRAGTTTPAATKRWVLDDARVRRALFECSKASLSVLDAIVDHAGALPHSVVTRILQEQGYDDAPRVAKRVVDELVTLGLLIPYVWRPDDDLYKLSLEIFVKIAPLVHGVSVPPVPPVPPDATIDRRGPRDALITIAALVHFHVRHTNTGPHRSDVKKLASALGRDDGWVDRLLISALSSDAIVPSNKLYVPRLEVLDAVAEGRRQTRYTWRDGIERIDGWFSYEALRRGVAADVQVALHFDAHADVAVELEAFERTTVDGVELARRPQPNENGTGDGHVTPSFEVFLGPGADLKVTSRVALAAEPTRLDTVATFKLTPKSIAAASRLGLSVDDVLGALERVGPHGVPANVRATVLDWASSVGTAKVRPVFAVECSSSETADRAARALGAHVLQRPTPTLLLVDSDPHTKLVKAGVALGADLPVLEDVSAWDVDPPLALLYARPDPELRARFVAAKAEPPPQTISRATPAEAVHGVLRDIPRFLRDRIQESPTPSTTFALRRLAELWEKQASELEAWLLASDDPKGAVMVLVDRPFALAPYLTLDPMLRARLRNESQEPLQLIASAIALRPAASGELGRLLKKPAVARLAANLQIFQSDTGTEPPRTPSPTTRREGRVLEEEHVHATTFLQAAADGRVVRIRLTNGRVIEVLPQRVMPVGDEIALGGEDPKTGEARSVSASDVVSIEV